MDTNARSDNMLEAISLLSKEGEVVPMVSPVDLTVGVKEWLGALEGNFL